MGVISALSDCLQKAAESGDYYNDINNFAQTFDDALETSEGSAFIPLLFGFTDVDDLEAFLINTFGEYEEQEEEDDDLL